MFALLLSAILCQDKPEIPPPIYVYLEASETYRKARIVAIDREIRELVRSKGKGNRIRDLRFEKEQLEQAPPYSVHPPVPLGTIGRGSAGILTYPSHVPVIGDDGDGVIATVSQILGENKAIVTMFRQQYYVEGLPTVSLADGQKIKLNAPVIGAGSWSYETITGAQRTIQSLLILDRTDIAKWAEVRRQQTSVSEEKETDPKPRPSTPSISEAERKDKQAALKLQLAERYRDRDPVKAADYARQAIRIAPKGSETVRKAQKLLGDL